MKEYKIILSAVALCLSMSACTVSKKVAYLQDAANESKNAAITIDPTEHLVRIAPYDQLSISVYEPMKPAAVTMYNKPMASNNSTPSNNPNEILKANYTVDANGYIDFPILGKIKVAELTRQELTDKLKSLISQDVPNAMVNVSFVNFKVTVLGEVATPGSISISGDRINLLDALGMAGDMTIYGDRSKVLLIREDGDKREFHRLDLTRSDILSSPYYYLNQNDIIYVEPNKAQKGAADYNVSNQFKLSMFSTFVSAASVIISMLFLIISK